MNITRRSEQATRIAIACSAAIPAPIRLQLDVDPFDRRLYERLVERLGAVAAGEVACGRERHAFHLAMHRGRLAAALEIAPGHETLLRP
jgi:hypothetical protein